MWHRLESLRRIPMGTLLSMWFDEKPLIEGVRIKPPHFYVFFIAVEISQHHIYVAAQVPNDLAAGAARRRQRLGVCYD